MEQVSKEVNDAIASLIDSALPIEDKKEEVKQESTTPQVDEYKKEENEVGKDDKNYAIRKEKADREIKEALDERNRIREELASLKGELTALKDVMVNPKQEEEDPTEYMSEQEKSLYLRTKQLEDEILKTREILNGIANKVVSSENKLREENFFKNNPDIKDKSEAKELILNYVKTKPAIAKELLNGEVDLQGVYELALLRSGKPILPKQEDSTAVFGNGKSEPSAPRVEDSKPDRYKDALSVLKNKDSENKKDAIDIGLNEIAKDIVSFMG